MRILTICGSSSFFLCLKYEKLQYLDLFEEYLIL